MLFLTRRDGEALIIGDDIVVTVMAIKGNQVRIGIEAPAHVNIARNELLLDEPCGRGPQDDVGMGPVETELATHPSKKDVLVQSRKRRKILLSD